MKAIEKLDTRREDARKALCGVDLGKVGIMQNREDARGGAFERSSDAEVLRVEDRDALVDDAEPVGPKEFGITYLNTGILIKAVGLLRHAGGLGEDVPVDGEFCGLLPRHISFAAALDAGSRYPGGDKSGNCKRKETH